MSELPTLETKRLYIRPFVLEDLLDVHRLLDVELDAIDLQTERADSMAERSEWLQWTVLNYTQLAKLYQPPYGDRAVVLKANGTLIGACGYVLFLDRFEQIDFCTRGSIPGYPSRSTTEFGLFCAISPTYQRQGFATEAAQAMVKYAFQRLNLKRIVATTESDNAGSIGVMRRLGMRIEKNPHPEPPWLQVVGVLENK